jgi:poly(A) polymerase Pap1
MKKKNGISFWPQPILHLDVPLEDGGCNVVVIKACGYCNQRYHCGDVATHLSPNLLYCHVEGFKQVQNLYAKVSP